MYNGMDQMDSLYKGSLGRPATGFDNGAMIFHNSIVDFFIPLWMGSDCPPSFTTQVNVKFYQTTITYILL